MLVISNRIIFRLLIIAASLLVFASIVGQVTKYVGGHATVFGLVDLFNVNREQNIPTLFSVLLLITCSALLGIIYALNQRNKDITSMYWAILSLGFIYLAIDEFSELHEKLSLFMSPLIGDYSHGILHFSWVIPAAISVIFLGIFFLKFLLNLPRTTRTNFIIAGSIYIAGVIGMELPGAYYSEHYGRENLTYSLITSIEESLEILGLILFIRALLDYLISQYPEFSICFNR